MTALISARAAGRLAASVAMAALAGACARTSDAGSDSALARDLSLASAESGQRRDTVTFADTSVSRALPTPSPAAAPPAPVPQRTARRSATETPAPRQEVSAPPATVQTPAPAPTTPEVTPGPPAGSGHTFGVGTGMVLTTSQPICSVSNKAGDRFVATLQAPVTSMDGGTLAAGTDVVFELSSIIMGPNDHGRVELIARGISLEGYIRPIDAEVAWIDAALDKRTIPRAPGQSSDASKVGKGAMTGAVLGRIFGGRGAKGAVIGAAAGAAVGAAGARSDHQYEGCLPKGSAIRMRLTGPLSIGA